MRALGDARATVSYLPPLTAVPAQALRRHAHGCVTAWSHHRQSQQPTAEPRDGRKIQSPPPTKREASDREKREEKRRQDVKLNFSNFPFGHGAPGESQRRVPEADGTPRRLRQPAEAHGGHRPPSCGSGLSIGLLVSPQGHNKSMRHEEVPTLLLLVGLELSVGGP